MTWTYEVRANENFELDVDARLPLGPLTVDEPSFVTIVSREGEHVHYRVRLRGMAEKAHDVDIAVSAGGGMFSPPSSWLLRPTAGATRGTYRFRVSTPAGMRFETAVRRFGEFYEAPASTLAESTFAAFGALRVKTATPGFEVVMAPGLSLGDEAVVEWVRDGVTAIAGYFGRPPDGRATFFVLPTEKKGPTRAKTFGDGGAGVIVQLGPESTNANLHEDWVATHELVHVGFPRLTPNDAWFAEGLATYVEPIARARAGLLPADGVWKDFAENFPRGRKSKEALSGTQDIDRVYWGGALYFLLVDLRIREETHDAKSLVDAVRAIVATGGNVETQWTLERVLALGDASTGTHAFHDCIAEVDGVDLNALYKRLGLSKTALDETAPLASRRRAVTTRDRM